MDSGFDRAPFWIAMLSAIVLVGPYWFKVFLGAVNEMVFADALNKVLRAGDVARAKKLLSVVNAPLGDATMAAFATVLDQSVLRRQDAEDYRTAGATTDPETVKRRLTATFTETFDRARTKRWPYRIAAAIGALVHLVVVVELARRRMLEPPLFGSLIALAVAFGALRQDVTERRKSLAAFAALQEALYARAMDPNAPPSPRVTAKASLIIEAPGAPLHEVAIDEPVIKIGRAPNAQVLLEDERVARMHAVIENDDGAFSIIDLGAAAGTQVNGASVNKSPLRDGDRITIGPYTLTVRLRA
ncbi:MAG: FHA domain-containing protein [Polyangiales bacterium]